MNSKEKYLEVIKALCAEYKNMPVFEKIAEGKKYCYLYDNTNPAREHRDLEKISNAPYWAECNISTPQKVLSVVVIMATLNCSSDLILDRIKYIIFP